VRTLACPVKNKGSEKRGRESLLIVSFVNSRLKCNTNGSGEDFGWRSIGEAFSGPLLQFLDHLCKVPCRERQEIRTSDQIEDQARLLTYGEDARPPKLADHAVCSRVGRRRW
jgi:hypothetical protein